MTDSQDAEVLVVGGGIVGSSAAYHLADAGVEDVVVLERDGVASKASGRAAGHLSSYTIGPDIIEYCRSFHESLAAAHDSVVHHTARAYTVAHTDEGADRLRRRRDDAESDVEYLSGAAFEAREPAIATEEVTAALSYGDGVHTDPYSATLAVLDEAQALGVTLRREGVTDITREDGGFVVTTSDGRYTAPVVVDAAGAWSTQIAQLVGVRLPLKPRPSEIAVFETEADLDFPLLYCPDLSLYVHQEPNGDLLVGAGRNREIPELDGFSTQASEAFLQSVAETGDRITPHLLDAGLVNDWAGRCSATPDRFPLIGETSVEGFFVCAGMNGAGIMHSPFAGRLVADLVTGAEPRFDPSRFDPGRFGDHAFEIKNSIDW